VKRFHQQKPAKIIVQFGAQLLTKKKYKIVFFLNTVQELCYDILTTNATAAIFKFNSYINISPCITDNSYHCIHNKLQGGR